ncbi:PREDICTED: mediator of RNA polymerase II transcription subunit 15a-like isoform X2 [Populus euphratica]|uniref:Mediator of RNA polymerase II transcription subunit 15a-like isoform X2 n=1 Tax=Populus euphratica TaxID=75702 RepID=A0AAJ6TJZ1_POPEU|nr:PREDICTED: mediator of RNA polymerase II transcription subunit 15a-like isoform X2 [Populus euphratica]
MDANNWRPTAPGGEPVMDTGDWRTQLQLDTRQRIVIKIMETLRRHLPVSGEDGLQELKKIAVRFEEKIYTAATSQSDYMRKISLKMLAIENKSQSTTPYSLPPSSTGSGNKPLDPGGSYSMQSQVHNQGPSLTIPLPANQSQERQQLLSQNMQTGMASSGVQSSSGLTSALPPISSLTQTVPNSAGQNPNMQSVSGVSQKPVGNPMGQGVPSNMFANSQRQGRQQVVPQQQQQSQNPQQYFYQPQLQQQLLKQKLQQGNPQHSLVQSHVQQQQQNLLQSNQLQSSQQSGVQTPSVMQPSIMQTAPLSCLQQNQPSSDQQSTQPMLQQHSQPVLRQQQQPQQTTGIHQQRLLGQQNNLPNLQQQQLMVQQNNLSSMHQQQLGSQSIVSSLQQQQLLGAQSGNSSMQTNQHPVHMLQQSKVTLQQQAQQSAGTLLPNQGQQPQPQLPQQQLMSQIQSRPEQRQQQSNPLQHDLQQRFQASGSLLQQQNVTDQQKQLYQSQGALPEASLTSPDSTTQTGHVNGNDWQEEIYQKIKVMKDMYFPEINEIYQRIAAKLPQHDSHLEQPKSEQLDKLKVLKTMLERLIMFLQVPKNNITLNFKEKLGSYERQILNFLNTSRPRKPVPNLQQGQLPQLHVQPVQRPQSQVPQLQSHENQLNPQLQSMNLQGSVTMQQNNVPSLQHNSLSSLSGVSTSQPNKMNPMQSASNLDSGQGNALSSLQQAPVGSVQQNPVSSSQPTNFNTLSTQSGVSMLQSNIPRQLNSNMIQHQHLKQQQHEQQMLQTQQLKQQFQQRQPQQQQQQRQTQQQQHLMQKQQMMLQQQQQQLHQQAKQQLPTQMQIQQIPQPHQMNDVNEMKLRQGIEIKPAVFQQHLSTGQRTAFPHQQMKPGSSFPISSPQMLQHASPQLQQHSSPQIDQQNLLPSLTKTGTPLQSANSPFVVPSPSTPLAPSPMPGDSEKPISGVSSLSNGGNIVHHPTVAQAPAPSLAIGTPGISASPLLAEFTSPDGALGGALTTVSGKSNVMEQPLERMIKAVKSLSPKALSASVSDIGSVVGMIDRIAGSAPGNGSRAAAGEDLVAMTKCCLQARNFFTQDGMTGSKRMRRHTSAVPLNVALSAGSVSDSFKQFTGPETSDLESTVTSSVKRPKIEANHALLEEIRKINQRLLGTVVDISDEDVDSTAAAAAAAEGGGGTFVKCSFIAVALSPNLKAQYTSAQMSTIQPLRLLVPTNYPNCSPILLDKFPFEVSKEYEDLSIKAKFRFSISLRSLSQPMSLGDIASAWDDCARAVISEHAQQSGGGTFSSKYGSWENCVSAA